MRPGSFRDVVCGKNSWAEVLSLLRDLGAPLATQVAEREHLCQNLGGAFEAFLMHTQV